MARDELLAWIPPGDADRLLVEQLNFERLPAHIAVIMDGNGRWAAQRHLLASKVIAPASMRFATPSRPAPDWA